MTSQDYTRMTGGQIRALCRAGTFTKPTAGVALGDTQTNLVILRIDVAGDFKEFCRLNPKPCPLLEVTNPGQYEPAETAPGADLRSDLPRYRVSRYGICTDRPTSVES